MRYEKFNQIHIIMNAFVNLSRTYPGKVPQRKRGKMPCETQSQIKYDSESSEMAENKAAAVKKHGNKHADHGSKSPRKNRIGVHRYRILK